MSEIDDLLAQMKAEYNESSKPSSSSPSQSSAAQKSKPKNLSSTSNNLDKLLTDLKAEFKQLDNSVQSSAQQQLSHNNQEAQPVSLSKKPDYSNHSAHKLINDLKADLATEQRATEAKKQEQLKQQQIQQQQKEQRRRQALRQQAQKWLEQLDPHSPEGLWFEEFSYSYESKLEAAIDYLAALKETQL